jgi:hypothetical protein
MRRWIIALGTTAMFVTAGPALADDASCIQSYESTQTARKAGKLREAGAEAQKCAAASCPAVLSKDCQKWAGEIDALLPSLVFEVKSNTGQPLTHVKITANGQPLVDRADGPPVTIEPGEVKLHFESPEGQGLPVDQTITLKEGEKSKKVSVKLGGSPPPPPAESKPLPLGPVIFGAAGVIAAGVGTVFAIMGAGAESDLDACKPHCSADDVNGVSTKYAVADILFAAGAVSLVAAAYMFITRPTSAPPAVGSVKRKPGLVLEF